MFPNKPASRAGTGVGGLLLPKRPPANTGTLAPNGLVSFTSKTLEEAVGLSPDNKTGSGFLSTKIDADS